MLVFSSKGKEEASFTAESDEIESWYTTIKEFIDSQSYIPYTPRNRPSISVPVSPAVIPTKPKTSVRVSTLLNALPCDKVKLSSFVLYATNNVLYIFYNEYNNN